MKLYSHYKNKSYEYLDIVKHSENQEDLVLYRCRYENPSGALWVRPKKMFFENVQIDGQAVPRFRKIPLDIEKVETLESLKIEDVRRIVTVLFGSWEDQWFFSRLESHPNFLVLLAWVEGKLAGFKIGYAIDHLNFYSWLGGVLPEFQGVGIGRDLMKVQHDWCAHKGFKKIQTKTQNRFKSMLLLNLQEGFEVSGFEAYEVGGPKILMEKVLEREEPKLS